MTGPEVPPHWKSGGRFWELVYERLAAPGNQQTRSARQAALAQLEEIQPRYVMRSAELKQLRQALSQRFGAHLYQFAKQIYVTLGEARLKELPELKLLFEQRRHTVEALEAVHPLDTAGYFLSGPLQFALDETCTGQQHAPLRDAVQRLAEEDEKALAQISDRLVGYAPHKTAVTQTVTNLIKNIETTRRGIDGAVREIKVQWLKRLGDLYHGLADAPQLEISRTTAEAARDFYDDLAKLVAEELNYDRWADAVSERVEGKSFCRSLVVLKDVQEQTKDYLTWLQWLLDVEDQRTAGDGNVWRSKLQRLVDNLRALADELTDIHRAREDAMAAKQFENPAARELAELVSEDLEQLAEDDAKFRAVTVALVTIAAEVEAGQLSEDDTPRRLLGSVLQPIDDIFFDGNHDQASTLAAVREFRAGILSVVCKGGYEELNEAALARYSLKDCLARKFISYEGDPRKLADKSIDDVSILQSGYWNPQTAFVSRSAKVRLR